MAKKSRPSGKGEFKALAEEETTLPAKELNIPIAEGGIIDFYYFFNGIGILLIIFFIIGSILRYGFHML